MREERLRQTARARYFSFNFGDSTKSGSFMSSPIVNFAKSIEDESYPFNAPFNTQGPL